MFAYVLFIAALFFSRAGIANAQWTDEFVYDDKLAVKILLDGTPITHATEENPITVDLENPMEIYLQVNNTYTEPIVMKGVIWFYYLDMALFPLEVRDPNTNTSEVVIPANVSIPPVSALIDFGQILSLSGVDIATGLFKATLNFTYHIQGETETYQIGTDFYLLIPADPLTVITSVAGISAGVATVGAVTGMGSSIWQLFDGFQTAHKLRSIQKKASELKSLPNLTVLGATPALFSLVLFKAKMKKRKKKKGEPEEPIREDVSEFRLKQKIREIAPSAWLMDKCPKCKRKWNKKTNYCKKCKLDETGARLAYADFLVSKADKAVKLLGKKKSLSIRKIAKKTKLKDYNAGVIGAAMVDAGLTEITKIETPIRGFAMNLAGLVFLILTWQQLLGGATSKIQTTLTFIGAALSLAVIIALYIARKNQIKKFSVEIESMQEPPSEPTPSPEPEVSDEPTDTTPKVSEPAEVEKAPKSEEPSAYTSEQSIDEDTSETMAEEAAEDEGDKLTPEELDRERQ